MWKYKCIAKDVRVGIFGKSYSDGDILMLSDEQVKSESFKSVKHLFRFIEKVQPVRLLPKGYKASIVKTETKTKKKGKKLTIHDIKKKEV